MSSRSSSSVPSHVIEEYRRVQEELASRVQAVSLTEQPRVIAAVDVHLRSDHGIAVAVAMSWPELDLLDQRMESQEIPIPYIPTFLSFREAPVSLAALQALDPAPDLILVDGHGLAHPRRFGIACHVGVELEIPTVGVAKSVLRGKYEEPGAERGSKSPLRIGDELVGYALRTRENVKPVFVSIGNLITLDEAVEWTMKTLTRYKLPEPSRRAHKLASEAARKE